MDKKREPDDEAAATGEGFDRFANGLSDAKEACLKRHPGLTSEEYDEMVRLAGF